MIDINNLGSFRSIDAVWARYPEGGKEGDCLTVNNVKYRWNKYDQIWENAEVVTQSSARKTERFEGDLVVDNNLTVGGVLRAQSVRQPNCGLYETLAKLQLAYPKPEVGMWATIGNTVPAAIYRCDVAGVWKATGETGGIDSLDWSRVTNVEGNVTLLQGENNTRKADIESLQNQLNTLLNADTKDTVESFNEILSFLEGVKDNETLTSLINDIQRKIDEVYGDVFNAYLKILYLDGIVENVQDEGGSVYEHYSVTYDKGANRFMACQIKNGGPKYYSSFISLADYIDPKDFNPENYTIRKNRIFLNIDGTSYVTRDGITLERLGISQDLIEKIFGKIDNIEEKIQSLEQKRVAVLDESGKVDASVIPDEFDEVVSINWWRENGAGILLDDGQYYYNVSENTLYRSRTYDGTRRNEKVELSDDKLYIDRENHIPYIFKDGKMVAIASKNKPASIFNATTEDPVSGYYMLCDMENQDMSAIHSAWKKEKAVSGLIISFEMNAGIWKTYQYVGKTVTEANWFNPDNWKDFGSLAAGSETYIVIDELCGVPTGGAYTLGSAIDALIAYQSNTGVNYAKKGLVISYKTGPNEMETKQFQGELSDFKEVGLWKDFGGGSQIETSDEPEEDGEDAFSTGGAYKHLPAGIKVDTETEGVVKLQLENAGGDGIGDEIQFQVGTGSGAFSGTVINVAFRESPIYGNAGSEFMVEASVRSVSTSGSEEQLNNIEKVEIYDRDSGVLLESIVINKASSATLSDFDFQFDLSEYMKQAGTRRFNLVFTDDSGNTGSRNLNMTAVDVTISSVQTLQYTKATALEVNGDSKSIPLFKFANNASQIKAITEIFLNGHWQVLNEQIVKDTYSVAIMFNPNSILGASLAHGVYALRIHGEDVMSGVVGNYLHTSVFVVGTAETPLVGTRWMSDEATAKIKLYESIKVDYAVYDPNTTSALATVFLGDELVSSHVAYRSNLYTYEHQVTGVAFDGSTHLQVKVMSASGISPVADFTVSGTVMDALLKSGAVYAFDFANRSNEDSDKSIESNGVKINVSGSNYSTTGFKTFNGKKCLRIAEDVTAEVTDRPFADASIERTGRGLQFCFASKNLPDDNAVLMQCYNEEVGAGFYVTGKAVGIYCANSTTNKREERFYKQGKETTVAIVAEPAVEGLGVQRAGTSYYFLKLYLDGEEVAVIGYTAGNSNLVQDSTIKIDGTKGDFYLFYMTAWNDYFLFDQAFQNYLVKLTDTDDMIKEYNFENVMAAQQVSEYGGVTIKSRPQASDLYNRGMAYIVECPYNGSNIESLDSTTSTSQNMYVTLYYFNPRRPYQNFVAYDVRRRNQGTTSAKRPVKNPRYYLAAKNGSTYNKMTKAGGTRMMLLDPDASTDAGRTAIELAKCNKMQILDDSIPIDIITVKLDYSDSSNANDCGVCDQMNATYRALGGMYLTPAQRAFDGSWGGSYKNDQGEKVNVNLSGLKLNHSTANHPVAMFRSKDSRGTNPYFHAKGNWKEDKKEQVALGLKDVPGYNLGCLNYGDFVEYYGLQDETLEQTKARFLADQTKKTDSVYALTQYCGRSYKIMRCIDDSWKEMEGSMRQVNGKWVITGDMLNPTDGVELLNYQSMNWFKGVSSVEDLMKPVGTFSKWVQQLIDDGSISVETVPAWTYYFESLIDNDELAIAYALGKKVPYNLYEWLVFCDSCDTDKRDRATALRKWHDGLYKVACPESVMSYDVATDYDAATDQRAKNMQPIWYLEDGASVVNGVYSDSVTIGCNPLRMYLNKIYDCDTVNGKDNDGGQTVDAETDPNRMTDENFTNPYAGYGSILFRNIFMQQSVLTREGDATELSLQSVASAMRSCTATVDGVTLRPFSPEGAEYFFLTSRIKKWQKKLSSYDGERKYISFTATSDAIYFYALQGLGLTSLPAFIERRWRYRDGFYGVGNFFSGVLSGRVNAPEGARIRIRAAKSGYFGIGNDSSGSITEKVYLEAGQEYSFSNFSHEEGALLYIYQADRMSMIDLSQITLSSTFDFSVMSLVEDLRIGGSGYHAMTIGSYQPLTTCSMGELPFLKTLHIENTGITTVGCESCPRLDGIYAFGSQLQRVNLADGAKIQTMQLPSTYNYLRLRHLPLLTIDGIQMENGANVSTLIVENCAKIDALTLVMRLAADGTRLKVVRAAPINKNGDGSELARLSSLNLSGLDITLTLQDAPALVGTYMLTKYTDDAVLSAWQSEFADLTIHQSQYTLVEMDDTLTDPQNITNKDNNTTGDSYEPCGHISKIRSLMIPVTGKLNPTSGRWEGVKMSDSDYKKLKDGSDFDYSDNLGSGNDAMMRIPKMWYKGINDFKNQKKYVAWSSLSSEPISSASRINRKKLSQILMRENTAIMVSNITENVSTLESSGVISETANHNTYQIDVEGMKQVRYPGLNNEAIGACFLNESGVIISKYNMAVANNLFDFVNGDYIFINVPSGAKTLVFTSPSGISSDIEAIAVDSTEIEAIEPDWVESDECLGAIYQGSIDSLTRLRSVSGVSVRVGKGTSTTSIEWQYDADGNPINTPTGSMNYTAKDFQNLARRRGAGYQLIDYEMSKLLAILFFSLSGTRDSSKYCGYGKSSGGTTGYLDSIGNTTSTNLGSTSGQGNKCMGFESFFACTYEWMDMVAVNVPSFVQAFKDKMPDGIGAYPIDAKYHIYDPINETERVVQALTSNSGYCVARTKHGRFCDIVASKFANDNSRFATHYADGQSYAGSRCRVVGRSYSYASAGGGVVCASAGNASSGSGTNGGSRLAFRGIIFISE